MDNAAILAPISPNRRPRTQLSRELKGAIIGIRMNGGPLREIVATNNLPKPIVQTSIEKYIARGHNEVALRLGPPPIYIRTTTKDALIVWVRLHTLWTFKQVRMNT